MICKSLLESLRPHFESIGHCVIAGGAPRDELMGRKPKDWDVYVLGQSSASAVVEAINQLYEVEEEDGSNPGSLTLTIDLDGEKVQIIPSPCESLQELIESFDWNICLFGYDTMMWQHPESMLPREAGSPLLLHTVTHPMSTLRRGFRFCDRYQLWMNPVDIRRLCSEVLAQIITQEEEQEPEEEAIALE